ncbi:hypothetical protein ACHAWO_005025 [Cyclotella atomus]|uniref:Uncharacterized protein n=1 Tax=Cyclotella atomus TaxID=382360 RepID=A0ABD3PVN6_9STRA
MVALFSPMRKTPNCTTTDPVHKCKTILSSQKDVVDNLFLLLSNSLNVTHELGNLVVKSLFAFLLELSHFLFVVHWLGSDNSSGDSRPTQWGNGKTHSWMHNILRKVGKAIINRAPLLPSFRDSIRSARFDYKYDRLIQKDKVGLQVHLATAGLMGGPKQTSSK